MHSSYVRSCRGSQVSDRYWKTICQSHFFWIPWKGSTADTAEDHPALPDHFPAYIMDVPWGSLPPMAPGKPEVPEILLYYRVLWSSRSHTDLSWHGYSHHPYCHSRDCTARADAAVRMLQSILQTNAVHSLLRKQYIRFPADLLFFPWLLPQNGAQDPVFGMHTAKTVRLLLSALLYAVNG